MPFFLSPRFAMLLLVALPLAGGAVIHPHGVSAFLLGAWAGVLIVVPPLMIVLWVLGLRTIGQVLRPLARLPVLIGLTLAILYFTGPQVGPGGYVLGGGVLLIWARMARKLALI